MKSNNFRHAASAPILPRSTTLPSTKIRPYETQKGHDLRKTPSEFPMPSKASGSLVFRGWMKKKSDFWGKWNSRFVMLSDDGTFEWSAKDSKEKDHVVHGSFSLKEYGFRMESSIDTQKYRLTFTAKDNIDSNKKGRKVYVFEPNTQADSHGWSNAISNVLSRIRKKSYSSGSIGSRKSLIKEKNLDSCRKKGLILCENGEISCPIKRSLRSLMMRSFSAYKTVAMEFEVIRGVLLVYDIGAPKPLRRVVLKDAKVLSVKPPVEHADEVPFWFQVKLYSIQTGQHDKSLTIGT